MSNNESFVCESKLNEFIESEDRIDELSRNTQFFGIRLDCQAFDEGNRRRKRKVVSRRNVIFVHGGKELYIVHMIRHMELGANASLVNNVNFTMEKQRKLLSFHVHSVLAWSQSNTRL